VLDRARCHRAVAARDARFDGQFFVGVTSTGIACRPSCPARTPRPEHLRFFATAAAAFAAGFRACRRCRPDASPGSPEWDRRTDLAGRAMRLIADGVVDREGVAGLAQRLGYTERHVHRELVAAVGAGPQRLARTQRAQTARVLLETTDRPMAEVALAAGFASVRQFNATIREVYARTPGELRARAARRRGPADPSRLELRLAFRPPLDAEDLLGFLAARAVPGIEEVSDGAYTRSLRLPHGAGVARLRPGAREVEATLWLDDLRDLATAVRRCRRLLDLDADPAAIAEVLGGAPLVGPLVGRRPGLRVVVQPDPGEVAIRAVLGQQVSVAGAATIAGRLAAAHGEPLARPVGSVTRLFPTAAALRGVALPMPAARAGALAALADVALDAGADRAEARAALVALPGVGPWTAEYVALRGLGDPDAFLAGDLGVRKALAALGADPRPAAAVALAEAWRPYRAYAVHHLWAAHGDAGAAAAA
jgi:AraC family transcriptional regulator of adaptative response / DNA-3-methyladenine glycosylase II